MITKSEAIAMIENGHIAQGLLAFALFNGASALAMKKEPWRHTIKYGESEWEIACNGLAVEVDKIPPYSWFVKFNGWPAGVLSITGEGLLCAGEAGNEDNLRKALLNSIEA